MEIKLTDEYIKREETIERLKKNLYASNQGSFSYLCYQDAINSVQEIPAYDVEPVRHGRWIKVGYACGEAEWKCSACKETEWRTSTSRLKYCPFCGAMMDGGAE